MKLVTGMLVFVVVTAMCAGQVGAVLVGYEGFAGYTVGETLFGKAGSGNLGFAPGSTWEGGGAFHLVQADSLSYTNGGTLLTSGGSVLSTSFANDTRLLEVPLATTTSTGEEFWFSYLFKSGSNREDGNVMRFYDSGSGIDGQRIDLNAPRSWPPDENGNLHQQVNVGAWVNNSPNAGDSNLFKPVGEVDLLVLQYTLDDENTEGNQGVMRAYVNPVIGGAAPDPSSAAVSLTDLGGFNGPDSFRMFSFGGGAWAVTRDEIRWGSSFADVTPVEAGLAGDFNDDRVVDGADFLAWQRGDSPSPLNPADLATWQAAFGTGGASPTVGAVPEPTSLTALALGGAVIFWRRRRDA